MQETWVRSLGREVPLEKEMATHSSILAWRIPRMEEPGKPQFTGSQRVGHTERLHFLSVCKSLQCLISALTEGGTGGHLFRLTCSVVLWGGRNTANKYPWHVWGVLTVAGPHWVCHSPRWHVLPGSTLLSLQGALQGDSPKWALHFVHFPGQSHSGSRLFCRGTDPDGLCNLCPSQV